MAGRSGGRWAGTPVRYRFTDALSEVDPLEFERLLADYYRDQGFEVDHSGTGGRAARFDGGVDLRLRKSGRLTLVQCKRDTALQTPHNVVHQLLGVMTTEGAQAAIVVTSGEFTDAARQAGLRGNVQLIDGIEVRRLLGARLERLPPPRPQAVPAISKPVWQPLEIVAEGPWRDKRRRKEPTGDAMLIRVVAWIVLMLFLVFVAPRLISGVFLALFQVQAAPTRSTVTPARPLAPPTVTWPRTDAADARRSREAKGTRARVVEPVIAPAPMSAAEQARRDEETRRYLERVPEVTHYRYSPLDANRDPQPAGH